MRNLENDRDPGLVGDVLIPASYERTRNVYTGVRNAVGKLLGAVPLVGGVARRAWHTIA